MCHFTDIIENKVDLADIALMHDLIDIQRYNDRLLNEARQNQQPAEFYVPSAFRR